VRQLPLRLLASAVLGLLAGCALPPQASRAPELPEQARADPARFLVITVRNDPQRVVVTPGSTPRGYGVTGVYGVSVTARAMTHAIEHDYRLREVSAWPIQSLRVHCIVVRLPDLEPRSALIAQLRRDSRVESVQPLNQFTTETGSNATTPSGMEALPPQPRSYLPLQHNLAELGVLQAQRLSQGASVQIAIIDTGVDYRHPDLRGRIISEQDFVSGSTGDFAADRHGTEVAGVIAGTATEGRGVLGVAPQSSLIALKACWPLAQDPARAVCNSFTLAQALEAAIAARPDIVNLSLTGPPDPLLARLIRYGMRRGIIYVGAAPPPDSGITDAFPIDIPGVLGVQSAEDAARNSRDLLAPGHGILTLVPGGHYDFASGSSLATAEVTGIVALLLADGRRLPAPKIQQILTRSSRQLVTPAGLLTSVDACTAVADVLARPDCGVTQEATGRPQTSIQSEKRMKLSEKELRALGRDTGGTVVVAHTGT
jgi:hypothetical protein